MFSYWLGPNHHIDFRSASRARIYLRLTVSSTLWLFSAGSVLLGGSIKDPRPETIEAFARYLQRFEEHNATRLRGEAPFLWISEQPPELMRRVKSGEILTHHYKKDVDLPHGLVHNWLGVVFIPSASGQEVVSLLRDYDRHQEIYPEAIASRTLQEPDDEGLVRGYLRFENKRFVTVVLDTEHESELRPVSENQWYIHSEASKIYEVRNAGEPDEELLPLGADRGFLWRMHSYWRVEEGSSGVLLESNVVTLSRSIPWIIAWFVKPIVQRFPRETMERTLEATRAVISREETSAGKSSLR